MPPFITQLILRVLWEPLYSQLPRASSKMWKPTTPSLRSTSQASLSGIAYSSHSTTALLPSTSMLHINRTSSNLASACDLASLFAIRGTLASVPRLIFILNCILTEIPQRHRFVLATGFFAFKHPTGLRCHLPYAGVMVPRRSPKLASGGTCRQS